jgi:Flp pilus assembly protein TadG
MPSVAPMHTIGAHPCRKSSLNPARARAKESSKARSAVHLRADSKGAVYVEFLVALVPMFTLFWGLVQLNGLFLADIVAQHAAVSAVRAAIVCEPDDHSQRPQGGQECAEDAVHEILGMSGGQKTVSAIQGADVSLAGLSTTGNASVTATVTVEYDCEVPLVGRLICGGSSAVIVRKATLPNQGAFYAYSD